jgi:formylglycine-generating enzyme required for sulfatase activity
MKTQWKKMIVAGLFAGLVAGAAQSAEVVLDRQGGWEVVQSEEGNTAALFLVRRSDGERTRLAEVEVPTATVTNSYWDEYAGWDEAAGRDVGGMVERVDTVAAEYRFRAFVNDGAVYWEDRADGVARLWTAPCKTPEAKMLLAAGDAGEAWGTSTFDAEPWNRGAAWREASADGETMAIFENGETKRVSAEEAVAFRKIAGRKGVEDYMANHGYMYSGHWRPPSDGWQSEFRDQKTVEIPDGVTKIGMGVFAGCTNLESVTIPDGVTAIGNGAFYGCSNLTSVAFPESVTSIGNEAFYGCSGLTNLVFPEKLSMVGRWAFCGCSGLTSVTIPGWVDVERGAFGGCSGLTAVHIHDLATWCKCWFGNSANPLYYAHHLYLNGEEVKDLVIPDGVTGIGWNSFSGCTGLTSVTIPESVTFIGWGAFSGCIGLTSVTIPDGVKDIESGAFEGCSGLTSVAIGNNVTNIEGSVFSGCIGLTNVTIPDRVTRIESSTFSGCIGLTDVTIPDGVTFIGWGAFSDCSALTNVTMPDSVTNIGGHVFSGCSGLTSVAIPESMKSIGDEAFSGCIGLTIVVIPDSVRSIGWYAFAGCDGLQALFVPQSWRGTGKLSDAGVPEGCAIHYGKIPQTVAFDANGGACATATAFYPVGDAYGSLPVALLEGHVCGWYTDEGVLVTAESIVEEGDGLTLHARWLPATDGVALAHVTAHQRFPWNGLVDIDYAVFCDDPDTEVVVFPVATDGEHGRTLVTATLSGDGAGGRVKAGRHRMTWDARADNPGAHSSALAVKMRGGNAAQKISFAAIGELTWQDRVVLSATAASGLPVTFEVVSGPGVVSGNVLTFTEGGTVEVRAVQAGDGLWLPASATQTVEVSRAEQAITFAAIGAQFPTNRVELSATATSGLVVTFEVVSGPGKIDGNMLTFTGEGTVEVRAVQAGDERWLAAAATQTVMVCVQTISFAAIGAQLSTNRVELSATASSGLAVTFEVVSGPGVVEGNVLTFTGEGAVEVRAVQAGDERWPPAAATQTVTVIDVGKEPYMVLDLSAGSGKGAAYPVSYLIVEPEGGWTDEYKTTKLVLRRIESGTFMMGGQYQVTLTKPYYVGVFEVTQKQWELVMESKPSYFNNVACYEKRPVESVSWNTIRGNSGTYNWPDSSAVDANSFMGRLRARTGLEFDLPTEAQWEYACRAGTTTGLNSGKNLSTPYPWDHQDSAMDEVGRYWYNGGQNYSSSCDTSAGTAEVGSYLPNAWGLYDMHGNVLEWCLDWYGGLVDGATDPEGSPSGSDRVLRGGSWHGNAGSCASSNRSIDNPSSEYYFLNGFRLVRTLSE